MSHEAEIMSVVDIVIPTCNRRAYLSRAVSSVLSQSFQDFKIIVIDDSGSFSNCIDDWIATHPKIEVYSTFGKMASGSLGAAAARNIGLLKGVSELVTFLDDDDEYGPDFLMQTVNFHSSRRGERVVSCANVANFFNGVNVENKIPLLDELLQNFDFSAIGIGHGIAFQKRSLNSRMFFDEQFKTVEDTDFIYNLISSGFKATRLGRTFVNVHHHDGPRLTDRTRNLERAKECETLLEKHKGLLSWNPQISRQLVSAIAKLQSL